MKSEAKHAKLGLFFKVTAMTLAALLAADVSTFAGPKGKEKSKKPAKVKGHTPKGPKKEPPKVHKPKPKPKHGTNSVSFSGQATLVYLTNGLMEPTTIYLGDTGPLPATGGSIEVTVGATNISSLELGMGRAFTSGAGNEARSEVSIQDFSFTFHATNNDIHTVSFSVLTAEASAMCTTNGTAEATAHVNIEGLMFDGTNVVVTGEPNQMIEFPTGALIVNFHQSSASAGSADIMAAGLVLALEGCMHGGIGIVHADIVCRDVTPPPSVECDRITGGGFIVGTPSGEKGTLAVTGGIRRGIPVGHLNYIDHGTGMHVHSSSVVSYSAVDADIRQIVYNVSIDGEAGMATVLVADRGEPGVDDLFDLTLSNGYHAGGDLGGDGPGGGNIQLHKCPPGWMRQ